MRENIEWGDPFYAIKNKNFGKGQKSIVFSMNLENPFKIKIFVLKNSETCFQNAETRFQNAKTPLSRILFARNSAQGFRT